MGMTLKVKWITPFQSLFDFFFDCLSIQDAFMAWTDHLEGKTLFTVSFVPHYFKWLTQTVERLSNSSISPIVCLMTGLWLTSLCIVQSRWKTLFEKRWYWWLKKSMIIEGWPIFLFTNKDSVILQNLQKIIYNKALI